MRKPRKKRKPTFRERQMRLNKKRFNHEMRKKRKDKENSPVSYQTGYYSANLLAMFGLLFNGGRRGCPKKENS